MSKDTSSFVLLAIAGAMAVMVSAVAAQGTVGLARASPALRVDRGRSFHRRGRAGLRCLVLVAAAQRIDGRIPRKSPRRSRSE